MRMNNIIKSLKLITTCSCLMLLQSSNTFTMQNINPINTQDIAQNNKQLMEYKYGDIWNNELIQNATKNLELKLETWGYDRTLSELNKAVLSVISNCGDAKSYETELSKKATKQRLNNLINKDIVSNINSLEENINNLLLNVHNDKNSENEVWKIILEDYSDKYVNSNNNFHNDLYKILNTLYPSGNIMFTAQQYKDKISDQIKNALNSINTENEYDYFVNKYNNDEGACIIYRHLLDILENAFQKHFIKLMEQNWVNILDKYKNKSDYAHMRGNGYMLNIFLPKMFENNIIQNNISVYTLSSNDLNYKYKNTEINNRWKKYINETLIEILNNDNTNQKNSTSIINEFKEANLNKYNLLENNVFHSMLNNMSLRDIIDQYKNEYKSSIIKAIYTKLFNIIWNVEKDIMNYKSLDSILQNNDSPFAKQIYVYLINIRNDVLTSILKNIPLQDILNKYNYFTQVFANGLYDNFSHTMIEIAKDILGHKTLKQILQGKTEDKSFVITQIYDNLILIQDKLKRDINRCKSSDEVNKILEQYKKRYDDYIIQLFANGILCSDK